MDDLQSNVPIRKAKEEEIQDIKKFVDTFKEMDTDPNTFTKKYYERILKEGILLVAKKEDIIGVCFGKYNEKEDWADLLGLAVHEKHRKQGVGTALLKRFENIVEEKNISTIDLYAHKNQVQFFENQNYEKGPTYTAFRKKYKKNC